MVLNHSKLRDISQYEVIYDRSIRWLSKRQILILEDNSVDVDRDSKMRI
ncbi:MAG: hypothetical protein AAGG81_01020 [Chlamydiota bacterium]